MAMAGKAAAAGGARACRDGAATRPRMTFARALRAELLRMGRSPLVPAHLACALAGGTACGAYFATAAWDPALGTDAYVQLLGALMPLMAGIACGLAVDDERRAGRLANLTAVPARRVAVLAQYAALLVMGVAALAVALGLFAGILAAAGRLTLGVVPLAWSLAGLALGSAPLYALMLALALRFGRNVAIGVGAAGLLLAFFSVGGLAHGLMTGELTGATGAGVLGWVPFSWAARLGSLGVEAGIAGLPGFDPAASARVADAARAVGIACGILTPAGVAALAVWFARFEDRRDDVEG